MTSTGEQEAPSDPTRKGHPMPDITLTPEQALALLNRLRSNVVATQSASWSNMMYPLVAVLDAAGYEAEGATDAQRTEHMACYGGAGHMPTLLDPTPMPDDLLGSLGVGRYIAAQAGIIRIMSERIRQEDGEGWTADGDDEYVHGELIQAAVAYAQHADPDGAGECSVDLWPETWDLSWWKPSDDPIRNLEKAGALIAAEIDRLLRARHRTADTDAPTSTAPAHVGRSGDATR